MYVPSKNPSLEGNADGRLKRLNFWINLSNRDKYSLGLTRASPFSIIAKAQPFGFYRKAQVEYPSTLRR